MADDPTPQDPSQDPAPADPPPPADPPQDPAPPADPPKDPEPVPVDEDVVATRAENERLKAELEAERQRNKPRAPAPPKRPEKPKGNPDKEPAEVGGGKRKRRVSRFLGDHYDDEDE